MMSYYSEDDIITTTTTQPSQSQQLHVQQKVWITTLIFVISFTAAMAPSKLVDRNEYYFSVGNMFSAGVLLAAAMVHQLADGSETLSAAIHTWSWHFPLAEFLAGLTFLAFCVLEELLHMSLLNKDDKRGAADSIVRFHPYPQQPPPPPQQQPQLQPQDHQMLQPQDHQDHEHYHYQHHHHQHHSPYSHSPYYSYHDDDQTSNQEAPPPTTHSSSLSSSSTTSCTSYSYCRTGTDDHCQENNNNINNSNNNNNNNKNAGGTIFERISRMAAAATAPPLHTTTTIGGSHSSSGGVLHDHHHHDQHIAQHLHGSLLASVLLLLALSIHSILEGLAIGVSANEKVIVSTTIAILAHKAFAAFALGSNMVASEVNPWHFKVLVLVFCLCTPLGVLLGSTILFFSSNSTWSSNDNNNDDDQDDNNSIATAIVQCMVAGTFLYVSIVEVAMKELLNCRQPISHQAGKRGDSIRLLAFVLGYLLMSALAFLV